LSLSKVQSFPNVDLDSPSKTKSMLIQSNAISFYIAKINGERTHRDLKFIQLQFVI